MATGGVDDTCYDLSSDVVGGHFILRLCDPCIRDNKHNDASLFCTICKEFLCSTCKNLHLKYTLGNHDIISAQEADSMPSEVDMKGMDRCQEHFEMIQFICEDHSLLCCSECLFIHRKCKHVYKVKEQCRLHLEEYRSVQASLEQSSARVHAVTEDCEREIAQINQNESGLAQALNAQIDSVIVMLNDTRSTVLKEAHAKWDTYSQFFRVRQSTCESIEATIAEILPLYSSVLKAGMLEQAFILTRMFKDKIAHVHIEVTKQDETPFSVKINAEFVPEISALLKKGCSIVSLKMDDNSLKKGHTINDANEGPIASFSCRQDFAHDQKDLEQRGLPITISLIENRPDAAYTEDRLSHSVAERNSEGKLPVEYLDRFCPGFLDDMFFKPADPDKIIGDIYSFKLKGNDLFMAGNAYAALDCYSNAIELLHSMTQEDAMQKMGSHDIAVVYGNRAECFLKLGFYQQAHDDAMQSVSIEGHWYKAHIRVGKALKGLKDFMMSVQAFCNAYFCSIAEDKVKVEILVEIAPVLQKLDFHGRLDKIPIDDGHIWAQACYQWLSKNDWDVASAAFHQYEQSKRKQPHLALTLKPFCTISKLKVHAWCLVLMQYFLDCGADKKTISLDDGDTYLHAVVKITLVVGKSTELLKYLLSRFCRPGYSDQHMPDRSGNTVLHTSTLQRNVDKKKRQEVIEMLLKTTVDASVRNQTGKIALDYLPSGESQSRELLRMAMFMKGN